MNINFRQYPQVDPWVYILVPIILYAAYYSHYIFYNIWTLSIESFLKFLIQGITKCELFCKRTCTAYDEGLQQYKSVKLYYSRSNMCNNLVSINKSYSSWVVPKKRKNKMGFEIELSALPQINDTCNLYYNRGVTTYLVSQIDYLQGNICSRYMFT